MYQLHSISHVAKETKIRGLAGSTVKNKAIHPFPAMIWLKIRWLTLRLGNQMRVIIKTKVVIKLISTITVHYLLSSSLWNRYYPRLPSIGLHSVISKTQKLLLAKFPNPSRIWIYCRVFQHHSSKTKCHKYYQKSYKKSVKKLSPNQ